MRTPTTARLVLSAAALLTAGTSLADYPERNLQGTIQWGAGGSTDVIARGLTPHVEEILDTTIVLTNRPGGTGVIGTNHVLNQRADGYQVLYGAENPQLFPVLGLADFDYGDLHPVNLTSVDIVVFVVPADSPFQTMEELVAHIQENPGELRMGNQGAASLAATTHALIDSLIDFDVRHVTFAGEGPGITALQGGHIDFMPSSLSSTREYINSGRLRALAVLDANRLEAYPDMPALTELIPDLEPYMPYGSFKGAYVHQDTPDHIKAILEAAYAEAVESEEFQAFLDNVGATSLNLSGEAAREYLQRWQSVTAWAMYESGSLERSPEEFSIARP
ncbi:tripartite tricarboxylate transporter substrate binding protein [Halomonas sp. H5]|uniref:tripartite tricarboxylate transporter substrate binding protein n=1 Tax=Halomonas sp. H5 TaxID=3423910 RepID=UPI003D36FE3E